MITVFNLDNDRLVQGTLQSDEGQPLPFWFDLTTPTFEERQTVEKIIGCVVPDIQQIQKPQQRMSLEDGRFTMMSHMVTPNGGIHLVRVLFVMTAEHLVTVHMDPWDPGIPASPLEKEHPPLSLLHYLLDQSVTQVGQALEFCQDRFDGMSKKLFAFNEDQSPQKQSNKDLLKFNTVIGQYSNHITILQDHLEGIDRCIDFFTMKGFPTESESLKRAFHQLGREIQSTSGLVYALTKSAGFLQEATVSHIAINQNNNIELLTKVVAFLTPPLLVLGVSDIVFKEPFNDLQMMRYGTILVLSLLSSVMTYYWFKKEG